MHSVDDWELVARAQAGDTASFAELVRRYQGPIVHFCRRMVGDRDDAEDLAQECFLRLHRNLRRLEPRAKFSTAVFGIARNLALNYVRDRGRRDRGKTVPLETQPLAASGATQPDAQARLREIESALGAALERLSPEHREILILREIHGMDYDALAEALRCRKGTVRSRLARAREQLRQQMLAMGGDLL